MLCYHGSDTIVDVPKILQAQRPLDFGGGFYVTTSELQAKAWAKKVALRSNCKQKYINRYEFDYEKAKANPKNVIQGNKFRFTVLSERLIRLEYSIDGVFEDRPTEFAWNREFTAPKFVVREDERYIEIKTAYFVLSYTKNAPFYGGKFNHSGNLKVDISNSDNKYWYFGHPEVRNYGAPGLLLGVGKKKKLMKSLYSIDGFVSFNDSESQVFNENGELLGDVEIFTDSSVICYLEGMDDGEIYVIKREHFLQWMEQDFNVSLYIVRQLAQKLINTGMKMQSAVSYPLKYQVLLYIWKYISQYKTNCIPKLLIVEELGSNIRSINRILKQLAEEGMIVNLNGKIQVDDLNLILAMISDYDL